MLLLPSILVPPVVRLFDSSSVKIKYTVIAASAATALSLALKLELRAYTHNKTAKKWFPISFDARNGAGDTGSRVWRLLRKAPLAAGVPLRSKGN